MSNTVDTSFSLDNGPMRLRATKHGLMLFNRNDIYLGRYLDTYGEISDPEISAVLSFIRPGMTVLDVGANIGTHTVPFARAVGPEGAVYSFEPQRFVFATLCANVAFNALTNVRPMWAGAGEAHGTAYVPPLSYEDTNNYGGVSLRQDEGDPVRVIPIDSLDLPACHLIKVDVEGMERAVLRGAARTIARHRPLLYVENDRREHSAELIGLILSMGYRAYWHIPPLVGSTNFYGAPAPERNFISVNLLCLPNEVPTKIEGVPPVSGPEDKAPHWE